jgi:hypothetical protein
MTDRTRVAVAVVAPRARDLVDDHTGTVDPFSGELDGANTLPQLTPAVGREIRAIGVAGTGIALRKPQTSRARRSGCETRRRGDASHHLSRQVVLPRDDEVLEVELAYLLLVRRRHERLAVGWNFQLPLGSA